MKKGDFQIQILYIYIYMQLGVILLYIGIHVTSIFAFKETLCTMQNYLLFPTFCQKKYYVLTKVHHSIRKTKFCLFKL